jgi:peroxin-10
MATLTQASVRVPVAQQAEVLRASEKDKQVRNELARALQNIWQGGSIVLGRFLHIQRLNQRWSRAQRAPSRVPLSTGQAQGTSRSSTLGSLQQPWEPLGAPPTAFRFLSDLVFYWSTVGIGRQTPGEEFCDLFECTIATGDRIQVATLSWKQRLLETLLYATIDSFQLLLYWLRVALRRVARFLERDWYSQCLLSRERRCRVASTLRFVDTCCARLQMLQSSDRHALALMIQWLMRVHLALFYLYGRYYDPAKRLAGVRLVHIGRSRAYSPRYDALGLLLIVQLVLEPIDVLMQRPAWKRKLRVLFKWALELFRKMYASVSTSKRIAGDGVSQARPQMVTAVHTTDRFSGEETGLPGSRTTDQQRSWSVVSPKFEPVPTARRARNESRHRCVLCLDQCQDPTCTACGHVFCWICILDWVRQQNSCPVCRQEAQLNDLRCLYSLG